MCWVKCWFLLIRNCTFAYKEIKKNGLMLLHIYTYKAQSQLKSFVPMINVLHPYKCVSDEYFFHTVWSSVCMAHLCSFTLHCTLSSELGYTEIVGGRDSG